MPTLLRLGLENAIAASLLAAVAFVAGRLLKRSPALVHVFWVLVLVKLITPPGWGLPVLPTLLVTSTGANADTQYTGVDESSLLVDELIVDGSIEQRPIYVTLNDPGVIDSDLTESLDVPIAVAPVEASITQANTGGVARFAETATRLATILWPVGSVIAMVRAALAIRRFRRVQKLAKPASSVLQEFVEDAAMKIGLFRLPETFLINWERPPMVWSFGRRTALMIPAALWKRLDNVQRETLLIHELAHLKRGDHLVRWLELAVSILFWWLPVVWWARLAMREAEEDCCDAWVVWALPKAARCYADTLVDTVDFLSEAGARPPLLASGFGHVRHLKRRLIMIMQGKTTRRLGWRESLALLTIGAAFLPIRPTLAEPPANPDANVTATVTTTTESGIEDAVAGEETVSEDTFTLGEVTVVGEPSDSPITATFTAADSDPTKDVTTTIMAIGSDDKLISPADAAKPDDPKTGKTITETIERDDTGNFSVITRIVPAGSDVNVETTTITTAETDKTGNEKTDSGDSPKPKKAVALNLNRTVRDPRVEVVLRDRMVMAETIKQLKQTLDELSETPEKKERNDHQIKSIKKVIETLQSLVRNNNATRQAGPRSEVTAKGTTFRNPTLNTKGLSLDGNLVVKRGQFQVATEDVRGDGTTPARASKTNSGQDDESRRNTEVRVIAVDPAKPAQSRSRDSKAETISPAIKADKTDPAIQAIQSRLDRLTGKIDALNNARPKKADALAASSETLKEQTKRLEALEKALDKVLGELKTLRSEKIN